MTLAERFPRLEEGVWGTGMGPACSGWRFRDECGHIDTLGLFPQYEVAVPSYVTTRLPSIAAASLSAYYVVCKSEESVMSSMMHMPWVLVALVVIFALAIVGLFIAGRVFSTRKTDRDHLGSSQRRE